MADPTVVGTIGDAISGFKGELLSVGALAIGVAAAPFLLSKGWGLVKRFVK